MGFSGKFLSAAFVGVSLDNSRFVPALCEPLVEFLVQAHPITVIVVADELAFFNYFESSSKRSARSAVARASDPVKKYFDRLLEKVQGDGREFSLVRHEWSKFYTDDFYRVLRGLYVAIISSPKLLRMLRKRIDFVIAERRRISEGSRNYSERAEWLKCAGYVLEETAVAIMFAQEYECSDEYYPGDDATFLQHVYERVKQDDIWIEIGLKPHCKRFWNVSINSKGGLSRELVWTATVGCP